MLRYDGFGFQPGRCEELQRHQNRCGRAATFKSAIKGHFPEQRAHATERFIFGANSNEKLLTVRLLTTFLNFKIKVTAKSWQSADRRKHQKSAPEAPWRSMLP